MTFENIIKTIPEWLNADGPESEIVISSRARLARNLSGITYPHRAEKKELDEVVERIIDASHLAGLNANNFFRNDVLDEIDKNIFIERHLMSPFLASKEGARGVLVMNGEKTSILINEEDHLRLQSIHSGFDPVLVLKDVDEIESRISKFIRFAFSKKYGFLTSCPTNFGTGLRISVLIHLPALVITKDIQNVIRSAEQLGFAVRGYYGEGSDVIGNLFQISNQRSLGKSSQEIVKTIISVVSDIIDYEKKSAETLSTDAKKQLEDKVWRSIGILKSARMLSTHEFMNYCSAARLGLYLGMIEKKYLRLFNELIILTQPGHLQERFGRNSDAAERDVIRADIIRERFVDLKI